MIVRKAKLIYLLLIASTLLVCYGWENSDNRRVEDKADPIPFDFLEKISQVSEAGKIFLQGVPRSDSSGPYIVKRYYGAPLTFSMVFYPKRTKKESIELSAIRRANSDHYKDFICFAFVYPMKDPELLKDYHGDNVIYPVSVQSYSYNDGKWRYLSSDSVHSLTELSQFEVRSIYSIVH